MSLSQKTVILFFNKPAMTRRCLTAAKNALKTAEISAHTTLLVDNGSTRESFEQVQREVSVSFLRIAPNRGFSFGMNAGLKAAFSDPQTQTVIALSNDVEVAPDFYVHASQLRDDPQNPTLYCPEVYYLSDRSKLSYRYGHLNHYNLSHHCDPVSDITFPKYYPAAGMIWTRSAYELTQGFNEQFFCYWEDVELSYRCKKLGIRLQSVPGLKIHHLGRGTTGGKAIYSKHFNDGRQLSMEILADSV